MSDSISVGPFGKARKFFNWTKSEWKTIVLWVPADSGDPNGESGEKWVPIVRGQSAILRKDQVLSFD